MANRDQTALQQTAVGDAPSLDEIEVIVIIRNKSGDPIAAGSHSAYRTASASPVDLAQEAIRQAAKGALFKLDSITRHSNG